MGVAQGDEARRMKERAGMLSRLLRGSPEENLARLAEDDPLRLLTWSATRLRERFLLVDPERIFVRALGQIAFDGAGSTETLDTGWVQARLDRSIDIVLDEEREEERSMPFQCPPEDPRYGGLREIGVVGIFARTASTFFNAAPHHARLAFIYACLERRTLDECLRAGSWNLKSLHEDIWSGLRTLGYHRRDGRPEGCGEHIYLRGDL
jgi:hypothetical protein